MYLYKTKEVMEVQKQPTIYDKMRSFIRKYIPILSDKELKAIEEKYRKEYYATKGDGRKMTVALAYTEAIFQSNAQDRDEGEEYSYYIGIIYLILQIVFNVKEKYKILSIGSGLALAEIFAAKEIFQNSNIYCLDISASKCRESRRLASEEKTDNISFIIGDATRLPFRDQQQFNIIWSIGMLPFDKTSDKYKKIIEKIIKPGGAIIFN